MVSFKGTRTAYVDGENRPFYIVCLVAWPLNGSEAGGDLVLIQTSLLSYDF